MTSSMNSIAFLGVGTMGAGMAGRLLDAGFTVIVWNRHRDRANALVARGARAADSPKAAASGAHLVISMVADDAASRTVWLGPNGALAGAARGTVLIESSTLSPAWIGELAGHAAQAGCELLDAPVTGSRTQAASVAQKFSARTMVEQTLAVYEQAAALRAAQGRTRSASLIK